jgi:hypothetical protein
VTCIAIARQRLGKQIPAEANSDNYRTSIARQRTSKHTSLTTEAVFPAWSVKSGYKEALGSSEVEYGTGESSRVEFRNASVPGHELESTKIDSAVAE